MTGMAVKFNPLPIDIFLVVKNNIVKKYDLRR
jgi:hypothetical protein